jgi:hypothetical protein
VIRRELIRRRASPLAVVGAATTISHKGNVPMTNSLNIFDNYGAILKSIDPVAVEALDEHDQQILEDTLLACRAAENAEKDLADTRRLVHDAIKKHDLAAKADAEANPGISHVEAARAVFHANNPLLPKPQPKKPNKVTRAALEEAQAELTELQGVALPRAEMAVKTTSKARGEAIAKWLETQVLVTPLSVAVDYAKRSGEERAARVAAGLPADPVKPEVKYSCELERVMTQREKPKPVRQMTNLKAFPGSGLPIIRDLYKRG